MVQLNGQVESWEFSPSPPSFLLWLPVDWMMPTTLGRAICFTQFNNSNANLFQKPFTGTPRNNIMFNQISGHRVIQSSWLIKWTITSPLQKIFLAQPLYTSPNQELVLPSLVSNLHFFPLCPKLACLPYRLKSYRTSFFSYSLLYP